MPMLPDGIEQLVAVQQFAGSVEHDLEQRESLRLGVPVADPMRGGAEFERLVDACLG